MPGNGFENVYITLLKLIMASCTAFGMAMCAEHTVNVERFDGAKLLWIRSNVSFMGKLCGALCK